MRIQSKTWSPPQNKMTGSGNVMPMGMLVETWGEWLWLIRPRLVYVSCTKQGKKQYLMNNEGGPGLHTPYHKCSPTNILKIYTHKIIKPRLSRSSVICISSFSWSALSSSILLFLWSTYLYYTGCLESFLLLVSKDVGGSTSLNPIAFWLFWSILRLYENLPCRTSF